MGDFNRRATYLAMIEGSIGTKMFQRSFFRDREGFPVEVCGEGRWSCAFHVSGIQKMSDLVRLTCTSVDHLEKEMRNSGWKERCSRMFFQSGDVVFWEAMENSDGQEHRHCGFYCHDDIFVSNLHNGENGNVPHEHGKDYWPGRNIERTYFHPLISE